MTWTERERRETVRTEAAIERALDPLHDKRKRKGKRKKRGKWARGKKKKGGKRRQSSRDSWSQSEWRDMGPGGGFADSSRAADRL